MKAIHGEQPILEVRHLAMMVSLARTRSIARSAAVLGITPSALSHRLAEAQRRLNVRLFSRQAGRLHLTPAGETLLKVASAVIADLTKVENDARKLSGGIEHILRMTIAFYATYHWFPEF